MPQYDYVLLNFAPCVGILFLSLFLFENTSLDRGIKGIFFWLIALEFLELIAYSLELWTSTFAQPTQLRVFLSAFGYSVRPVLIYLLILLNNRNNIQKRRLILLGIPLSINLFVAFSAFFSDIAYSYTSTNVFVRGPLGYTAHVILLAYLVYLLASMLTKLRGQNHLEAVLLTGLGAMVAVSVLVESLYDTRSIGRTAIVLSTVFYYMFFQTQVYRESIDQGDRIRQKLEQNARLDCLTGLLNKRAFLDEIEKLLPEAVASDMSLVFLDLDCFKQVNDSLGHLVGDRALRDVARELQHLSSKADLIARFGGDEFCTFLPVMPLSELHERLSSIVTSLRMTFSDGVNEVAITASVGAVYWGSRRCTDCRELLGLADEALYQAKNLGRNRYVVKEVNK